MGIFMGSMGIGTFANASPPYINPELSRDSKSKLGNRTFYVRDCKFRKEDPAIIIKWMRRNFGERRHGWDFSLQIHTGCVTIELWDDKFITMYEMWQM
jgi:hypothetical protein